MNFVNSIIFCFKNYFTTNGRATRSEYWYFTIFVLLMSPILTLSDIYLFPETLETDDSPLHFFFSLIILCPWIAVTTRRLHDVNRNGWWQLITITIIGIIPFIYWMIKRGDSSENKYG